MAAFPVRQSKLTWRVVAYRSDGSFEFVCGTNGPDYKLKRNAQKAADWYNYVRRSENSFAVVKRVRVTETECEEEEA